MEGSLKVVLNWDLSWQVGIDVSDELVVGLLHEPSLLRRTAGNIACRAQQGKTTLCELI